MKYKEMIKALKGKMVLVPATFALAAGLALTGCGDADALEPNTQTSEIVSEVVSEEPTEEISEVVSEETTEIVDETDYSAEAVMALVDSLTETYKYDDPEHIKAAVIAANLDYITAEDLDTLLNTYGYSMETINEAYIGFLTEHANDFHSTHDYYNGEVETPVSAERDYQNNMNLSDIMLNKDDKIFAEQVDDLMGQFSLANGDNEVMIMTMNMETDNNAQNLCTSYIKEVCYCIITETPFEKYQNVNTK